MKHRLTSSRLDLADRCPGSHVLPWADNINEFSDAGTVRHAWLALAIKQDRPQASGILSDEWTAGVNIRALRSFFDPPIQTEKALAWDPDRDLSQDLGERERRDYSGVPDRCLCVTIDAFSVDHGRAILADWKTGHVKPPEASSSLQLKLGALALARHARRAEMVAAHMVHFDADGKHTVTSATWDPMDLDGISHELVQLRRKVDEAEASPTFTTGTHCSYCPAFAACPAQAGAAQALVAIVDREPFLRVETVSKAWTVLQSVERACEKMRDAIEMYVESGAEIPLPNGKTLKRVLQERREIDPVVALKVLVELTGNPSLATTAIKPTTSQVDIARVLKTAGGPKLNEALGLIDAAGGIRTLEAWRVKEVG